MSNTTSPNVEEKLIYAEVVFRVSPGISILNNRLDDSVPTSKFQAAPAVVKQTIKQLSHRGFKVLAASTFGVSISGTRALFKDCFQTDILLQTRKVALDKEREIEYIHPMMNDEPIVPEDLSDVETVYIPPKIFFHIPPVIRYRHLELPDQVCQVLRAEKAHNRGFRGAGVKVAMVDSGLKADHEYYNNRNYQITIHGTNGTIIYASNVPSYNNTPGCFQDSAGHGTEMAANLLAIAPECDFHMFKTQDGDNINDAYWAAFKNASQEPGVKVISCSWGLEIPTPDMPPAEKAKLLQIMNAMKTEIQQIVNNMEITVVFSCGNFTVPYPPFPGCLSDVISVGGVDPQDIQDDNFLTASDYACSGVNPDFPKDSNGLPRNAPDVCGICGPGGLEFGRLILMPTQGGSYDDQKCGGFPINDGTLEGDGWVVGSGTSSAAAEIAGGVALLINANNGLTPLKPLGIKEILKKTARDVKTGSSSTGQIAVAGNDGATGYGMVNLKAAVDLVNPPFWIVVKRFYSIVLFKRFPPWLRLSHAEKEVTHGEVNLAKS